MALKTRYSLTMLVIIMLSSLFIFPARAYGLDEYHFRPLNDGNRTASQAFASVCASFAQMETALAGQEFWGGYYLIKAASFEEILADLQKAGFSPSLSARIISACLYWHPQLKRPVLIPADSLPALSEELYAQTEYWMLTGNIIILHCRFFDCYQAGDQYSLLVISVHSDGSWIIYDWQLYKN